MSSVAAAPPTWSLLAQAASVSICSLNGGTIILNGDEHLLSVPAGIDSTVKVSFLGNIGVAGNLGTGATLGTNPSAINLGNGSPTPARWFIRERAK